MQKLIKRTSCGAVYIGWVSIGEFDSYEEAQSVASCITCDYRIIGEEAHPNFFLPKKLSQLRPKESPIRVDLPEKGRSAATALELAISALSTI